jgi:3-methylcrotonyl-CoA carboxylase alpha subunit
MHKLLIANRGEIARRIIRTAHAMGIDTVALYSDADALAPHVREATQAVHIGPSPARDSYLDGAKILAAAKLSGADAIHPGYGFLSENADFAADVIAAGLIWVGPPPAAMRIMGLKDSAKAAMKKAGVPITPGYQGNDQSLPRIERAATQIGYPLLIKAVAGGGGKGMRSVFDAPSLAENLLSAQREGQASFGNPSIMLEKLIARPRHVEVQVFADRHDNVVHLFERDCSLQRRHQKVIEEAPAPGLSDNLRHMLGVAACAAATAIKYEGAGTCEFILDLDTVDAAGDPAFYFMEMNTRLQVEHPVTECITGFDLVEWQIRVARGEMLPAHQAAIGVTGHAVEARFYAEDPESGFLPSTGTLKTLRFPAGPGIRIDSGVNAGSEISQFYDPMIAKVIAHGADRAAAIDRLVAALDGCVVEGVKTNRAFLARLVDHQAFRAGDIDTGFIARHADDLAATDPAPDAIRIIAALALASDAAPPATMFDRLGGWRLNLPFQRHIDLYEGDGGLTALALTTDGNRTIVSGLAAPASAIARWVDDLTFEAEIDGVLHRATVLRTASDVEIRVGGRVYRFATRAAASDAKASASDARITAPMPGRVLALDVKAGDTVAVGDRLLVLEAMKMEHRIVARMAGVIASVAVDEGDQVGDGTLLIEIEGSV